MDKYTVEVIEKEKNKTAILWYALRYGLTKLALTTASDIINDDTLLDKKEVLAENGAATSALHAAFFNNHAETVIEYAEMIRQSNLDLKTKAQVLSASKKNRDGYISVGILTAWREGFIYLVQDYLKIIAKYKFSKKEMAVIIKCLSSIRQEKLPWCVTYIHRLLVNVQEALTIAAAINDLHANDQLTGYNLNKLFSYYKNLPAIRQAPNSNSLLKNIKQLCPSDKPYNSSFFSPHSYTISTILAIIEHAEKNNCQESAIIKIIGVAREAAKEKGLSKEEKAFYDLFVQPLGVNDINAIGRKVGNAAEKIKTNCENSQGKETLDHGKRFT